MERLPLFVVGVSLLVSNGSRTGLEEIAKNCAILNLSKLDPTLISFLLESGGEAIRV
jgi:hypothetical protein